MSEDLEQTLRLLRSDYLAQLPARRQELNRILQQLAGGEDQAGLLKRQLHQLAGSGGSYGFGGLSRAARETERLVNETDDWSRPALARLQAAMTELEREMENAMSQQEGPPEA